MRKQGGVSAGAVKQLVRLVRDVARRARRAEVIYANTQRAMVVAALAGRLARKPVVWHLRDIVSTDHFGSKQLMAIKYCARLGITRVIANSDASAQAFRTLTGFTPQHVDVVFNGISAEPFDALEGVSQAALRTRLGLPKTRGSSVRSAASRTGRGSTCCWKPPRGIPTCMWCWSARRCSARTNTRRSCTNTSRGTGWTSACISSGSSATWPPA